MDISVSELSKINNPNIIDIRPVQSYNNHHILNAKNIPYNTLILNPQLFLNKEEIYYIYCQKGNTSKKICQTLQKQGYKAYNIIGGYEAWILNN